MSRSSRFSLRARRRNLHGAELELHIQALGIPAIGIAAILAIGLLIWGGLRWLS